MSSGRHTAYIMKSRKRLVYYTVYVKSRMSANDRNKIMALRGKDRLLKEKEQILGESFEVFINRVEAVAEQIAKQLGLRYHP